MKGELRLVLVMIRYIKYIGISLLALLLFVGVGCRKNRLEPTSHDAGYGYFPFEVGNTWIYRVDSIHFNPFNASNEIDTFTFYVKYVVSDTIKDNNGIRNSIISAYRTTDSIGDYSFHRNFTRRITDYRAETIDSNIRVVSLVFPPSIFKYWDSNAFNKRREEEAEIIHVGLSERIGDHVYDSTVHVLQRDDDFKTLRNYGIEKYAKHIGLVYSHQISWTKKTLNDPEEVPDGFDYTYTLLSFED